jgi:hypothetical protein
MLTQEEILEVITSNRSIKEFCISKGISRRTFYNYIKKYNIKSKNSLSKENIKSKIGIKINRWTIIEYLENEKLSGTLRCRCECGTEQKVRYYDIISEQTKGCNSCSGIEKSKNCGKYKRKIGKNNWKFSGYKEISGHYWANLKHRARKTGKELSITIEYAYELLEKQNFKCKISGLEIELPSCMNKRWTASLDRIDSTKGYIEGNVQWLHKDINTMKWNFNQDQFIKYCKIITENNKNEK